MIHSVANFIMVAAMAAAVPSEFPVSDIKDINKGVGVIADNTDNIKVLDVDIDIWNCLFAVLAFGVGIFAAVYDWKGYKASKMTADNVVRVSEEVQVAQFNDLIRHFHRNLICSLAMSYKQVDGDRHTTYISESHLYKLKTLPEDIIHTERYNTNNELYSRMHEMKLLLRNYDMEIDVALMHFKNSDIDVEDLIAIDFDNLVAEGSMMGSGGMIVMDEDDCMVSVARFYLDFTVEESCGKCTPCRIGNKRLLETLNRITDGKGTEEDLKTLSTLGRVIKDTALCGLGQTSPNPVLSTLSHFYDEYLEHVRDHRCRAKQCKALLTYIINPTLCIGCHLCAKNCPADAIIGDVRKPHVINPDKCIKCGMCMARCRFKAISVS